MMLGTTNIENMKECTWKIGVIMLTEKNRGGCRETCPFVPFPTTDLLKTDLELNTARSCVKVFHIRSHVFKCYHLTRKTRKIAAISWTHKSASVCEIISRDNVNGIFRWRVQIKSHIISISVKTGPK